ncbi:hypothetical protein [Akkermansia muciniphila]|uniref:hypothetical protein n=1 Tax=Akkermansia muciniphila TaxID=239935 RepID=UPI000C9C571A|nr:hypothetical protein [Akkermansia muciniphila]PNC81657.1 hypothetical protein CXT92_08590 [Akkermansia muciniphila]PND12750.1 hypothetical protein CXT96_10420 [Akkermansia muciniphila]
MVELNTWAGLEPAVMDIKTVSFLAQVFELTLTDSTGSVVDLEGVTFRGAVNTAPLQELMCSVEGGKVLFGWSGLPAGRHSFDLFLVTGQVEKALVRGAFVVSGRVMPPLDQESYSVNHAATLVLPDNTDGIILVELSEVGLVDLLSRKAGAFAEEARDHVSSVRELKEFIVQKVDGFGYVVDTATTAITEVGKSAVESVESGREEAVKAVEEAGEMATTAITEAGKSAVESVESSRRAAVGTITPLVQRAETAKEAIDQAEGRINTAATNAVTSATESANSATAAQQALEAIPQVDASGNMTLAGGLTAAGAINANGGINIPLVVGAPTDTGAVNRFYTSGLAGAVSALVQPIYLNSSSITVAGSISKASNGTLAGLTQRFSVGAASAGSNAYGSAVIPLIGPNGQFNYSSVCGFSLAVSATAFAKFTFGIGRGSKTNRTGLTMDSYSIIPGNNLAVNYGEVIDVTINTPYDTVRKGYEIRVREIFYVSSVGHWQVKTTTVFLPVGHNELMPNGLNRLIYMQSGPPSTAVREEKAALYMELGGGSANTLFKIASLRGFIAFEAGTGVSTLIIDARNEKTYALSADAGTGTRHLYTNGLTNPTYHALEAMAVNAIESEETADFEDINIPL